MTESVVQNAAEPAWKTFKLKRNFHLREEYNPYPFQDFSVYKSLSQKVFVFGLPTGTGKSLCALQVYTYYLMRYPTAKTLIVTDNSTVLQFSKEIGKFYTHAPRISVIHRKMAKYRRGEKYADSRNEAIRRWGLASDDINSSDVLIVNWAIYRLNYDAIYKACKLNKSLSSESRLVTIFDEASAIQNVSAETGKRVKSLCTTLADKVVGLTATLSKGKLESIYGIFSNLGLQITRTKKEFEERFCIVHVHPRKPSIRTIVGYKNVQELATAIGPYCIHLRKSDVAEFLPAFTLSSRMLEESDEQLDLINQIYRGAIVLDPESPDSSTEDKSFDEEEASAPPQQVSPSGLSFNPFLQAGQVAAENSTGASKKAERLTASGYIKRALMDPFIVSQREELRNVRSPKTEEIIKILTEQCTDEKIVIYTPSRVYLERLAQQLRDCPTLPQKYKNILEIRGGIPEFERERFKMLFSEDPDYNVMILNDAGIQGINLQVSDTLIVTSMPKNGGDMIQLAGRISRIGSKHSNLNCIFLLHEDSQDEDEYLIIQQQMQIVANIAGGEPEQGLIDWALLKEAQERDLKMFAPPADDDEEYTKEELEALAKSKLNELIFHKRQGRKDKYMKRAKSRGL